MAVILWGAMILFVGLRHPGGGRGRLKVGCLHQPTPASAGVTIGYARVTATEPPSP